jgi:hypothetical protein
LNLSIVKAPNICIPAGDRAEEELFSSALSHTSPIYCPQISFANTALSSIAANIFIPFFDLNALLIESGFDLKL